MKQPYTKTQIITALMVIAFLFFGGLLAGGSYTYFQEVGESGHIFFPGFTPQPGDEPIIIGTPDAPNPIDLAPTPAPWNGTDRVTMLLLGLDYRDWESGSTASRSDTMILLTIDPVTKTAGILSIPRDLWANIPGFEPGKINTAYYYGEAYQLPGGGPALAMETVEHTIGVPIDYYAQIDFAAFERFIDLIGGVKLDIQEPITVDPLGDRHPRTLEPGVQTLPGYLALAYARNRSTPGGDFARAERQQQVIMGIRNQLLRPGNFAHLIENADEIYAELSSGIHTNLPLQDAIQLAVLAVQVADEDIQRGVINERYVNFGRSPDDLAILIPIPDRIRELRDQIFGTGGAFTPLTTGNNVQRMQQEAAAISILNGSGGGDLGTRTASYLQNQGAQVLNTAAYQAYAQTIIIDYTGNPFTLQYLTELFGLTANQIHHQFDPNAPYDVEIILGSDWLYNNPLP